MAKVRVPVFNTVGKCVTIDANPVTQEQLAAAIAGIQPTTVTSSGSAATLWRLVREVPANIVKLAALATNGLITRTAAGNIVVRSIAVASTSRLTITNAAGDAGDPTLDLADVSAVSAWGRSANSSGKPAAIAAAADDTVLQRVGSALSFGALTLAMAANDLWTYAKLQNVSATSRLLGRITAGAGDIEELTGTQATTLLDNFTATLKGTVPPPTTATGKFLKDNGTWDTPAGGGGGSLTFVNSAVVAGAAATTLAITGLDLNTDGQYNIRVELDNATASASSISFYFNADTTAGNYDRQLLTVDNATNTGSRANSAVCAGQAANGTTSMDITVRKRVDGVIVAHITGSRGDTTALLLQMGAVSWRTTGTNVTGFTISSSVASSLAIGSIIRVWKQTT